MAEINQNEEPVIEIKDLYKSFGDLHVLQGVNLKVDKGENVVVLGRSGTGKSVLIKIIAGLLKQDSGVCNVLGREVAELNQKELTDIRLKIGFSFQNSALYDSMTVRENLEFPLVRHVKNLSKAEINEQVEYVLDAVGLLQTINQVPSELSGGQRKRIGIARTLILKPEIMLYDEPTAGLDPITCLEINQLINEVKEKYHTSSIIITHDLTCARETGDRIAMLLDGKFLRQGTFEEVFATDEERIKSFYDYNFIQ
ncbi:MULTISPECIES: ABC transporter ATP-binding protein [Dyadobacter]|jgi:phospholipid/cholesterol/gamma-HCH transport system ATP-binding protein|uniref:ATP-binding cassette domain-containing protein n=1 Tax=Dyadobacter chenhuakuii TaxID=2909339 RepID=A0A9X1TQN8_9BACT|nr:MULTISPECIES: ATP-binding cassette domain-containing protein [Dyadobacter]MCE7070287.1 ATP-binding cassette domain-containing protein [Dyadobacter sp. CY327]MCF2492586.1 ATP-binding cassette domain-containing protein [Dyadobacter chenhuakuii]MCF2497004.1 ATP-binding cassette domain-containing protein [Dyadobacter chenhuakuii]MCF2520397.1 ATP-binding cassette domain-containing protein [Dyadobacter sp. CY351]USJ33119.1 ATP-binding cassette domain-containing protein [Dyadobacter chenhuakuii]